MQSASVSQVHCLKLGSLVPLGVTRHLLPMLRLVQALSVAQTQKLKPVPAMSLVLHLGPLERGLSVQWPSLRHSSQRLLAPGFFGQWVGKKSMHS